MKNNGKRWLCWLLILSLCLSLFSVTALAAEPQPAETPAASADPAPAPEVNPAPEANAAPAPEANAAPETNGEPTAPAGEDASAAAPEDGYEKAEDSEKKTETEEPVTPPDDLYPDVTVELQPDGVEKTAEIQPDGKKLLPEGLSEEDVEWIYAMDKDGNRVVTGYTRKTESVTEPSPDVPEEIPAGGNTTEDENGSSYTFVVLPDAPQGGTTTNEDGTTTETTVEPIYGEDAFAGLVIGYQSTTTVKDKDGNALSSSSDAVWGTKVTVKTTETVDEAANKKTTTTTTTEVFTRGVTETTETVTATPRQLTASMSEITDTSSVEELYKKMIGPDKKYQEESKAGDEWWFINGNMSFSGAESDISAPDAGKYRYTGGWGLVPGFAIKTYARYVAPNGTVNWGYINVQTPQLELMDSAGNKFYVYCIDQSVNAQTEAGFDYDMLNLDDAGYLTDEQRAHIRAIAQNGFWGTLGKADTDAPVGSMNAIYALIKQALADNPEELLWELKWFREHQYDDCRTLGPGIALAATQAALWTYGKSDKRNDITGNTNANGSITGAYNALRGLLASKYLVDLMEKNQQTQPTESRILNPHDLSASLTVKGPRRDDGSYLTDLTFDLNGSVNDSDDLVLKLKVGEEEKTIRISGAQQEGEIAAKKGESGGYTIPEIALFPSSELTLSLSGTQQIERGVYIFQHDNDYGKTQTLVGLMETGTKKTVNLTTTLKFNVTEAAQRTTETVSWLESRTETTTKTHEEELPQPETPETPKTPEEPKGPETPENPETPETPETPVAPVVPGYDVPKTGDASGLYAVLAIFSALGLAFVTFAGKKRCAA